MIDPYQVIRRPHTSEKSHEYVEEHDTYVFKVVDEATKSEIKQAVEMLWNVKVKSVRTLNVMGKQRRFGRYIGRSKSWKKAMVRLQDGQAIEILK